MDILKQSLLTLLVCGLIGLTPVYADQKTAPAQAVKKFDHQMFAGLNLTQEQKDKLHANKDKKRQQMKALHEQMKVQKQTLHYELMNPKLDMKKINAAHGKIKSLEGQMDDLRLNSILEVRKILTPEQFSKFLGMMKERRSDKLNKPGLGRTKDAKVK